MTLHIFRSLPFEADSRTKRNGMLFSSEEQAIYYTWEKGCKSLSKNNNVAFPFDKNGTVLKKALFFHVISSLGSIHRFI